MGQTMRFHAKKCFKVTMLPLFYYGVSTKETLLFWAEQRNFELKYEANNWKMEQPIPIRVICSAYEAEHLMNVSAHCANVTN
jgi:hypothetical protein